MVSARAVLRMAKRGVRGWVNLRVRGTGGVTAATLAGAGASACGCGTTGATGSGLIAATSGGAAGVITGLGGGGGTCRNATGATDGFSSRHT